MVQYHGISKTSSSGSGGKKKKFRDKRLSRAGGFFSKTKLGEKNISVSRRTRGGNKKSKLKQAAFANVSTKQGTKKTKIIGIAESPDNWHYTREKIITLGTVIETALGKARVTSRPGQHGSINAVLVESGNEAKSTKKK